MNDIERFLRKDRQIKEYRKKLDFLKDLVAKVQVLPLRVPMNLFLIDCSRMNRVGAIPLSFLIFYTLIFVEFSG